MYTADMVLDIIFTFIWFTFYFDGNCWILTLKFNLDLHGYFIIRLQIILESK